MNPYLAPKSRASVQTRRSGRHRWLLLIVALVCVLPFFGYGPGSSAVDNVSVKGRITTTDGRPLARESVTLTVPIRYWLPESEAKDAVIFGNRTRFVEVTTDSNGEFSHSFGLAVYHIDFFFVPFQIRIPRDPPPLVFSMGILRVSSDPYRIRARDGWHEPVKSPVTSLTVREELRRDNGGVSLTAFVELELEETALGHINPSPLKGADPVAIERAEKPKLCRYFVHDRRV